MITPERLHQPPDRTLGFRPVLEAHNGFLCSCFLAEACKQAGRDDLIPEARRIRKIADGHTSLAVAGNRLLFVPDDDGIGRVLKRDDYGRFDVAYFCRFLEPGSLVVDVGANCGFFSLMACDRVGPEGVVVAVEPDPDNFAILRKNLRLHKLENLRTLPTAAGAYNGHAVLYKNAKGNHGDHRVWKEPDDARVGVEVSSHTLDELFASVPTDRRVAVKIDVQGWEGRVLEGTRKFFARCRDLLVMMELWPWGLMKAGDSVERVLGLLESCEFRLHLMDSLSRQYISVNKQIVAEAVHEQSKLTGPESVLADILAVTPSLAAKIFS